jgi:UDP-N-acetylmuramoyl-tripeptide--D-alanyl-D-alanine ligase
MEKQLLEKVYELFLDSSGVSTDTRTIETNSIFFCLKGENFNANQFAQEALEKGAKAVVVDEEQYATDPRIIYVENVLICLQLLANHHRKQFTIPFIGITGSNGKTTTKEMMYTALSSQLKTHATQGNYNNHIGVPLTLLRIPQDTEIAIIEMGANHPGEIAELCKIAEPDYGIITNIGKAHLEGFGGYQGVINTKRAMYDFVHQHGKGCFVHGDDPMLMELSEGMIRKTFGQTEEQDYVIRLDKGNLFLKVSYQEKKLQTQLLGDYNYSNVAVALAVGSFFQVETDRMLQAIAAYKPANQRSQLVETSENKIYLDAYNANPTSMTHAIESFIAVNIPHRTFILGDMLEMGEESLKEHQTIVDLLHQNQEKNVLLVGAEFAEASIPEHFLHFTNTHEAKEYLHEHPIKSSFVLVKGSRGIGLEKLMDNL